MELGNWTVIRDPIHRLIPLTYEFPPDTQMSTSRRSFSVASILGGGGGGAKGKLNRTCNSC